MIKLVDICSPKQWKTIGTAELSVSGYPVYGANGIIGYYSEYNHEFETLLITCRGATCGAINISTPKSYINGNAMCLDNLSTDFNLKFMYYYLKWYDFRKIISGSAQPQITINGLNKVYVPELSLDNQRHIVSTLDTLQSIITHRRTQLEKLDLLVKARFVEMFGDPVSNPYNWEKISLGELAEIKIGPFGSLLHKEDYVQNNHALINPSHIIDGKVFADMKLTVSDEKYKELHAYQLFIGDVVMGRRGEMGRCAVVTENGLLCGTGSMIIRTNGRLKADYIQKIISFPSFKKTIEDMAVGQTMPNLNVPIVSKFMIICPPIEVQEQYYSFVEKTDKLKVAVQKALDEAQLLFDSLMQEYFG